MAKGLQVGGLSTDPRTSSLEERKKPEVKVNIFSANFYQYISDPKCPHHLHAVLRAKIMHLRKIGLRCVQTVQLPQSDISLISF